MVFIKPPAERKAAYNKTPALGPVQAETNLVSVTHQFPQYTQYVSYIVQSHNASAGLTGKCIIIHHVLTSFQYLLLRYNLTDCQLQSTESLSSVPVVSNKQSLPALSFFFLFCSMSATLNIITKVSTRAQGKAA